ncbi:MAG: ABC transporter ATP-binding protein [Candidatus Sumerlaeia bacterium]|nr:ABC transporter ATP-binding protein [Candidatus Sumerlaeia bacterium]
MITINNVSKKFKLYKRPANRLLELFGLGTHHDSFWALRNITLEVPRGRALGIVGQNGAGKSTLLKLITGTLLPTEGTIDVNGRVAALLELGTGFHMEFTGRQNIHVNGQILGMSPEELRKLEAEIIAFSELGPFIDQPLRTYSSGMVMRLGFSIAAALRPEILIVDEALSVGDARFSQKCTRRIREIREQGATILFVSHDPSAVSSLCDEAILLNKGTIQSLGTPRQVLEDYNALLASEGEGNRAMTVSWVGKGDDRKDGARRSGTFQALISRLEVRNKSGTPCEVFRTGDLLRLYIRVLFLTPVENPTVGIGLRDRLGLDIFGTNTALHGIRPGRFESGEVATFEVEFPLRLGYGDYSISVAVHEDETHLESCFEWADNAAVFRVREVEKCPWSGLVHHEATFLPVSRDSGAETVSQALTPLFGDLPKNLDMTSEHSPSPYLKGVEGLGEHDIRGPHRWLATEAWIVCRPVGEKVRFLVGLECRDGDSLRETRIRISVVGRIDITADYIPLREHCFLEFHLPADLQNSPVAFRIETVPSVDEKVARQHLGMTTPAGLALYGIYSNIPDGDGVDWPVIQPHV